MLEAIDMISQTATGYKGPKHFWTQWTSGKGLLVSYADIETYVSAVYGAEEADEVYDNFLDQLEEVRCG